MNDGQQPLTEEVNLTKGSEHGTESGSVLTTESQPTPAHPDRTWELTLLVIVLAVLGWCGMLRAVEAVINWAFLTYLGIYPGPWYLVFSGLTWGMGLLVAATGLVFRQHWATAYSVGFTLFCTTWYWVDRLLLTRSVSDQYNLPFLAGLTVTFLIFEIVILRLHRQRKFFGMA